MAKTTASGTLRDKQGKSYVDSPSRGSDFTAQEVCVGNTAQDPIPVVDQENLTNLNTITQVDIVSNELIYIGAAIPGSANSDAAWLIQRVTINGSDIDILFANSERTYTSIWDDRGSLSYG